MSPGAPGGNCMQKVAAWPPQVDWQATNSQLRTGMDKGNPIV